MQREAAVLMARGQAPVLVREAIDAPGSGEVLVAMRRAPINPADLLTIDDRYAIAQPLPTHLGAEGVGEVVAIGSDVTSVAIGDTVLPLVRGNWTTYRLLDQHAVLAVPASLPIDQAAMLRINPATAWRLVSLGAAQGLKAGDWILQNGGRSIVAHWVRVIAGARGYRVLNIVRRGRALCETPHEIVDDDDLAVHVARLVGDAAVPLALDCVAGAATGRLAAALSPGGQVVVFGHLSGAPCEVASTLLTASGLSVRGFSLRPAEAVDSHAELVALYARLADLMARADTPVPIAAIYPLGELDAAIAHARTGSGRVLLALDGR